MTYGEYATERATVAQRHLASAIDELARSNVRAAAQDLAMAMHALSDALAVLARRGAR